MNCISLRTSNISADQICANWLIFAFLELENAQAFSACCCAHNIVTLINVFGFLSFLGRWSGLCKLYWAYLVAFAILIKYCVRRILWIVVSLFDLISFRTDNVFVEE